MGQMALLEKFSQEWNNLDNIVVYGLGNVGQKAIKKLQKDFNVIAIIDNDTSKWGSYFDTPVIGLEKALKSIRNEKIIVMTGGKIYKNISGELENLGLKEYKDFCSIEEFLGVWYWKNKKENCLLEVHVAITMECTLKCENCNMFVTHYGSNTKIDFLTIKRDIDSLFKSIDYVCCLTLLGGEPFLNRELANIIKYIGDSYGAKIGTINIITNGTIIPDGDIIDVIKKYGVLVYISDYTHVIPYNDKINKFIEILNRNNINNVRRKSNVWKDFGFPEEKLEIKGNIPEHMNNCSPLFHGLNDGKFYYCHVLWSAEKSGLYKAMEGDYVDLLKNKNNKELGREIVTHALGMMKNNFVSLCKFCGGCGDDNPREIKAAIQKR